MGKRWTDKEDGILETLRDGGMTFEEVASIMGRTKQAVQQRAHMLKRNEPTFREVVDTAFEKHGIEFGEHGDWYEGMSTKQVYNALEQENTKPGCNQINTPREFSSQKRRKKVFFNPRVFYPPRL